MKSSAEIMRKKSTSYKRRQAIAEHHYGTLKRQWGFSYILRKNGMKRAVSDVGFMSIAYNLRRIGNIFTREVLREYLRILVPLFFGTKTMLKQKIRSFATTFFRIRVWRWKFTESFITA
jgi:hypothetical protein